MAPQVAAPAPVAAAHSSGGAAMRVNAADKRVINAKIAPQCPTNTSWNVGVLDKLLDREDCSSELLSED